MIPRSMGYPFLICQSVSFFMKLHFEISYLFNEFETCFLQGSEVVEFNIGYSFQLDTSSPS